MEIRPERGEAFSKKPSKTIPQKWKLPAFAINYKNNHIEILLVYFFVYVYKTLTFALPQPADRIQPLYITKIHTRQTGSLVVIKKHVCYYLLFWQSHNLIQTTC